MALTAGGVLATAAPAQAATSGVDIAGWCKTWFNVKWAAGATPLNANDPYSWRCTYFGVPVAVGTGGVDMNAACRYTTGRSWAYAYLSYWSAYGWRCQY